MVRKRILIVLYVLLLCITVSFAWIFTDNINKGRDVVVDYYDKGQLIVAPDNIEAEIWIKNANDDGYTLLDDTFTVDSRYVVPNSIVSFKIRLRNLAKITDAVTLSIADYKTSNERLLEMMYISVAGGHGYTSGEYEPPSILYKRFDDAKLDNTTYSMDLYNVNDMLYIPPTGENNYVELDCYLYFDQLADSSYQGMSLTINTFRIAQ